MRTEGGLNWTWSKVRSGRGNQHIPERAKRGKVRIYTSSDCPLFDEWRLKQSFSGIMRSSTELYCVKRIKAQKWSCIFYYPSTSHHESASAADHVLPPHWDNKRKSFRDSVTERQLVWRKTEFHGLFAALAVAAAAVPDIVVALSFDTNLSVPLIYLFIETFTNVFWSSLLECTYHSWVWVVVVKHHSNQLRMTFGASFWASSSLHRGLDTQMGEHVSSLLGVLDFHLLNASWKWERFW